MSSEPRHLHKKPGRVVYACHPTAEKVEAWVPGACGLARLVKSVSASLSVSTTKMESKRKSPAPMHTQEHNRYTSHLQTCK